MLYGYGFTVTVGDLLRHGYSLEAEKERPKDKAAPYARSSPDDTEKAAHKGAGTAASARQPQGELAS